MKVRGMIVNKCMLNEETVVIHCFIGDTLLIQEKYQEAVDVSTEAFQIDICVNVLAIKILHNRAELVISVMQSLTKAPKTQKNDLNLLLLRAECYESIAGIKAALNNEALKANSLKSSNITTKIQSMKVSMTHRQAEKATRADDFFQAKDYKQALKLYDGAVKCWGENLSFHES